MVTKTGEITILLCASESFHVACDHLRPIYTLIIPLHIKILTGNLTENDFNLLTEKVVPISNYLVYFLL